MTASLEATEGGIEIACGHYGLGITSEAIRDIDPAILSYHVGFGFDYRNGSGVEAEMLLDLALREFRIGPSAENSD